MAIHQLGLIGEFSHRHLDWQKPLYWLEHGNFLVAEENGSLVAVLACPESPKGAAWVRYFCVEQASKMRKIWNLMWDVARWNLLRNSIPYAVILPQDQRLVDALNSTEANEVNSVISYKLDLLKYRMGSVNSEYSIREMRPGDLLEVEGIDRSSFELIWQLPLEELRTAFQLVEFAHVAEVKGEIVGYQFTVRSHNGCHLARLAVMPRYQGLGIGKSLVTRLVKDALIRGFDLLTVNTQSDNFASKSLYRSQGFIRTAERYPVYWLETGKTG